MLSLPVCLPAGSVRTAHFELNSSVDLDSFLFRCLNFNALMLDSPGHRAI